MTCTNPLLAYRKTNGGINFMRKSDYDAPHAHKLLIACGKCSPCKKKKAKTWAIRMENEAKMHEHSSFLTLTFADEHLPKHNTLRLEDPQKFLKRLRKYIAKTDKQKKIKAFYCGEYGTQRGRAHYHLCIFGWIPNDMILFTRSETGNIYTSRTLEKLWSYGFSTVSEFTPANAQYTANYVLKDEGLDSLTDYQCVDEATGELIQRLPPFQRMSLRPALGFDFYEKYKDDYLTTDAFRSGGKVMPTPDAYLRKLKKDDPDHYEAIKLNRHNKAVEYAERNPHLSTLYGLDAVETITNQRIKNQKREIS